VAHHGKPKSKTGGKPSQPAKPKHKKPARHHSAKHHKAAKKPAVAPEEVTETTVGTTPWSGTVNPTPFSAAELKQLSALVSNVNQPPAWLIPIYKAAGRRYHIPWRILAAINSIETNYGHDLSVSSAGALGWMQFMPETWAQWGLDVTGKHKQPNPYDPRDAIFSAARYLAANGGRRHLRQAIFAYNHAQWYVDAVIWRAHTIHLHAFGKRRLKGYSLPLDGRYMR
jgi:membrane-bound lytic murein transglycosylase B